MDSGGQPRRLLGRPCPCDRRAGRCGARGAGRIGDGVVLSAGLSTDSVKQSLALCAEGAAKDKRDLTDFRRAGYLSARTIEPGWVEPASDPFRLTIVPMPDTASASRAVALRHRQVSCQQYRHLIAR